MASDPTRDKLDNTFALAPSPPDIGATRPTAAGLQSRAETTTTSWLWGLLILGACYGIFYLGGWATSRSVKPPLVGPFTTSATPHSTPAVIVQVAGAVAHPGVYHLPFDARITDAIHEAGGPLPNADTNALNLAAWVEDGTRIEVPTKAAPVVLPTTAPHQPPPRPVAVEHLAPTLAPPAPVLPAKVTHRKPKTTRPTEAKADPGIPHATTPSGKASKKIDPSYLAQHPVNVNTAPAPDLQGLPGIGPAMAAKIIAYRQENGRFQTVDDLRNVKGIGEKKLEKLQPLVTVK